VIYYRCPAFLQGQGIDFRFSGILPGGIFAGTNSGVKKRKNGDCSECGLRFFNGLAGGTAVPPA